MEEIITTRRYGQVPAEDLCLLIHQHKIAEDELRHLLHCGNEYVRRAAEYSLHCLRGIPEHMRRLWGMPGC